MKERHMPQLHSSEARDEALNSSAASRERRKRQEAARKARRSKLMRRFVTPLAIASAAGAGTIAYIVTHDGDSYRPRTTVVHPGDTLSEIADEELQKQGDADPTTQEINEYTEKIADANPDEVSGNSVSASAPVGDTLTLPKK